MTDSAKNTEGEPKDHECKFFLDSESEVHGCECGLIEIDQKTYYPKEQLQSLRDQLAAKEKECEDLKDWNVKIYDSVDRDMEAKDKEIAELREKLDTEKKVALVDINNLLEENMELREQLKQREEEKAKDNDYQNALQKIKELEEALENLTPIVQHVVNGLLLNNDLNAHVVMKASLDKAYKLINP